MGMWYHDSMRKTTTDPDQMLSIALESWQPVRSGQQGALSPHDRVLERMLSALSCGANPNTIVRGKSALMYAISLGSPELLNALVDRGVDMTPSAAQPMHPLALVAKGYASSIQAGADETVCRAHEKMWDILLDAGVSCHPGTTVEDACAATRVPEILRNPIVALVVYAQGAIDVMTPALERMLHAGADPRPALKRLAPTQTPGPCVDLLRAECQRRNLEELTDETSAVVSERTAPPLRM